MLIIDNATVSDFLRMKDCIPVKEEAFRKIPEGCAFAQVQRGDPCPSIIRAPGSPADQQRIVGRSNFWR